MKEDVNLIAVIDFFSFVVYIYLLIVNGNVKSKIKFHHLRMAILTVQKLTEMQLLGSG